MGMVLKYGSYTFNSETTVVPIEHRFEFDAQGRRDREVQSWRIRTVLQDTSTSGLNTKSSTLEAAMVNGSTLTLYYPNGSTKTIHEVEDCTVSSISWPNATGPEYAVQRTVQVEIRGYVDATKDDDLVSFQESISFSGGGARYVLQETITGTPVKHRVAENTIFRASQQGSATGKTGYPSPPGPAFPGNEAEENPELGYEHSRTADGDDRYTLRWRYVFASAFEMQGVPSTWS